ncbi:MAG: SHOCT domain-containing protein [Proteobacteria bacterium]|nr:SHOCT domain-containing protein [Pseudomonadota bacterium]MBU1687573.1 SHOCT domain-containing protein [Pseudomonadota bacterium]
MFGDYGMGFGSGMGLFMLLFWLLIVLGIFMLVKALLGAGKKEDGLGTPETAEEILKKRYARGEIKEDEFRKMLDNLR